MCNPTVSRNHSEKIYLVSKCLLSHRCIECCGLVSFLGEVLGFENLVFSVFEFIHGLIETPKFKKTVKKFLDELIYFLVLYMQITEDQVRKSHNLVYQYLFDM